MFKRILQYSNIPYKLSNVLNIIENTKNNSKNKTLNYYFQPPISNGGIGFFMHNSIIIKCNSF